MPVTIKRAEYFYVVVDDKPGEWTRLLNQFKDDGVNLYGVTAFPLGDGRSQIDLFPQDSSRFRAAASVAGIKFLGPEKAFLIQGEDQPGALLELHQKLSDAGINVHAANGVSDGSGRFGYLLWVKPEDYEKAAQALKI